MWTCKGWPNRFVGKVLCSIVKERKFCNLVFQNDPMYMYADYLGCFHMLIVMYSRKVADITVLSIRSCLVYGVFV